MKKLTFYNERTKRWHTCLYTVQALFALSQHANNRGGISRCTITQY